MSDRTFLRVTAACNAAMDRDRRRRAYARAQLQGRRVTRQAVSQLAATFDALFVAELDEIARRGIY